MEIITVIIVAIVCGLIILVFSQKQDIKWLINRINEMELFIAEFPDLVDPYSYDKVNKILNKTIWAQMTSEIKKLYDKK